MSVINSIVARAPNPPNTYPVASAAFAPAAPPIIYTQPSINPIPHMPERYPAPVNHEFPNAVEAPTPGRKHRRIKRSSRQRRLSRQRQLSRQRNRTRSKRSS